MKKTLLDARLEWEAALARRRQPRRRALLWTCQYLEQDGVFIVDARLSDPPFRIDDWADRPPEAVLVVLHPALRHLVMREYLIAMPVTHAEADRLIAEAYVELAIEEDPTVRATLGW